MPQCPLRDVTRGWPSSGRGDPRDMGLLNRGSWGGDRRGRAGGATGQGLRA